MTRKLVLAVALLAAGTVVWGQGAAGAQQFASLGDLKLHSGQVLRDCRVGYRAYGTLNRDRSNAVVLVTWFGGTSESLARGYVGSDKAFDPARFFIVVMDALGGGVSSSPSNSTAQPRRQFPAIAIADMVEAEHRALVGELRLAHVHAVAGASMGGMQTFQWMVQYPGFMDVAIPIVGTPRQTSYDLLLWTTEAHAIEDDPGYRGGVHVLPALISEIHGLALYTPQYRVSHTAPGQFAAFLEETDRSQRNDADDWLCQLHAMMALDVARDFAGSMERAAAGVEAQVLVIAALQDHMVNPTPALDFARLIHARVLELNSECGHIAAGCEMDKVIAAVREALGER
ncbi:MAG: alpha/beta fold hydrolase [Acidobacteria bacterium]|nr:alpha/beta fold hydrolase [Acidobacteriota bacterium]